MLLWSLGLWKALGDEEEEEDIEVALADVPRRVTQGQVSNDNNSILPPAPFN